MRREFGIIRRTFRACVKGRAKPHGNKKGYQSRYATSSRFSL